MRLTATTTIETVEPQEVLSALWHDDRAGVRVPAGTAHAGARLHRCQRGNVSLLVLFMGLVFYALAAMTWNTGEVTTAKIEAQTAADSVAYSSAVWTSRAINIVAATNMIALRDASALGVAVAVLFEGTMVGIFLAIFAFTKVAPALAGPQALVLGVLLSAVLATEAAVLLSFVIETGWPVKPVKDILSLNKHMGEIMNYQEEWVRVLGGPSGLIATQAAEIGNYYDCDVQLLRGDGSASIDPPLRAGNAVTCLVPMTARFAYDALGKGTWYQDARLKLLIVGKGRKMWVAGSLVGYAGGLVGIPPDLFGLWPGFPGLPGLAYSHHVLSSQPPWLPFEFGPYGTGFPSDPQTWAEYTVLVSAQKRTSNVASSQLPRYPLRFMAPGLFDDEGPMQPVAYAQAETFNGVDGLLSTVDIGGFKALQPIISIYPWRVWTDWGWQWQPRLTHGNLLRREVFQGTDVNLINFSTKFRETVTTH